MRKTNFFSAKKGLPPVNDLAVAMAREIINCQATKTKFNLQKYLDRSSLPNKQDVHMAKAKAHQLVQKHFKNIPMHFGGELGAKGPKSKCEWGFACFEINKPKILLLLFIILLSIPQ